MPRHSRAFLPSLVVLGLFSTALLTSAASAQQTLELDPEQTTITFYLKATGHDVEGSFSLASGSIGFDPESGKAWGEISVNTVGAETGHQKRDKTMHKKVLLSEKFPLATFRPEAIEGDIALEGESQFDLVGTFTLLGVEHALTLPTTAEIHQGHVEATATFELPYVEWGLHNPSMVVLRVAKQVAVTVSVVGKLEPTMEATSG